MPVLTLKFKLPEESEEYRSARLGSKYQIALERIFNEVFRPARKHGYSDKELQTLSERPFISDPKARFNLDHAAPVGADLISKLEILASQILREELEEDDY